MRARRTLRTTLVAAGATAVLAGSASGAFAAAAPQPAPAAHAAAHHHCKDKRVLVKTVRLADKVSVAKVYKTGKHHQHFEAEIWAKGTKFGTLVAKGKPAHGENNGLHVTLRPNGEVTSWVERAKPKPKPQPVAQRILVSVSTLADDTSTGKVYRLGPHHYEADIYAHGHKLDTLAAKGRAAHGENNGLHVVLKPDGKLVSWVEDASDHAQNR